MTNVHEFDLRDDDRDAEEKPLALPLTFFDDLSENPPAKPWLIKNVIARDETSSWIAPPGKGKSALLTDIAVHNAADKIGAATAPRGAPASFFSPWNAPTS